MGHVRAEGSRSEESLEGASVSGAGEDSLHAGIFESWENLFFACGSVGQIGVARRWVALRLRRMGLEGTREMQASCELLRVEPVVVFEG